MTSHFATCSGGSNCSFGPHVAQLIADGLGGFILRWWEYNLVEFNFVAISKLTRWSAAGVRTEFDNANVPITKTSSNGRTALQDGSMLDTVAQTPIWAGTPNVTSIPLADGGEVGVTQQELTVRNPDGAVTFSMPWTQYNIASILGGQGAIHAVDIATAQFMELAVPEFDEAHVSFTGLVVNEVPAPFLWEVAAQKCAAPPFSVNHKNLVPNQTYTYRLSDNQDDWIDQKHKDGVLEAIAKWNAANTRSQLGTQFVPAPEGVTEQITLLRGEIPPQADPVTGDPVFIPAGMTPTDQSSAGTFTKAFIRFNTDVRALSSKDGYLKAALHEIGHLVGLGDNKGFNGSSVMNQFGQDKKLPSPMATANDIGRNLPTDVRRCDEVNASLAPARSWP